MEELLEGMYCFEDEEWGFKVKNLSQSEQLKIYKKIEKLKAKGKKITDDEFTLEMFKEIIECNGKIKFKGMKIKDFQALLNSEHVNEVFEELCFNVGMWVTRIVKSGIREQLLQVQKQEVELMNTALKLAISNCYDTTCGIERSELAKKKINKQISKIKKADFSELEKLVDNIEEGNDNGLQ
ncbi:hypothetical protein [Clostridium sardiniense]|uniref:hypothetical protein n=1 Tax=Clostridium sardiniense TaxID=29369 RepID=UPI00195C6B78|nr:hypothetical protein [Clostridium sardiniense]MBM7835716.1 hypothetical protein [Clostridium sardiniense]